MLLLKSVGLESGKISSAGWFFESWPRDSAGWERHTRITVSNVRFRIRTSMNTTHLRCLWTDCVTVAANCFHGLTSGTGIHLFQNSMDVVSHGEFGEIQLGSDLLICQTFGDEGDQLLLPQRKIRS